MAKVSDVYLDDGMRKWIAKTARKEHWRMAAWYDLDDLIQDGIIVYCRCRDKYTLKPPEPGHGALNTDNPTPAQRKHFMSLVMMAYNNHIMTLASRFARTTEDTFGAVVREDQDIEQLLPPQQEEASLFLALSNAPAEIKDLVDRLLKDGLDGGDYLRSRVYKALSISTSKCGTVHVGMRTQRGRRQLRETSREFWRRVVGDGDLPKKLADYLRS